MLKFEKARLRKMKGKEKVYVKLAPRYYGPFKVSKDINGVAFRLELLDHWKIHNACHVSLLKKYQGPEPTEFQEDPPEVEELEEVLQPEQIVSHTDKPTRQGKVLRRYLVKFKNYSVLHVKWFDEEFFIKYLEILTAYQ